MKPKLLWGPGFVAWNLMRWHDLDPGSNAQCWFNLNSYYNEATLYALAKCCVILFLFLWARFNKLRRKGSQQPQLKLCFCYGAVDVSIMSKQLLLLHYICIHWNLQEISYTVDSTVPSKYKKKHQVQWKTSLHCLKSARLQAADNDTVSCQDLWQNSKR